MVAQIIRVNPETEKPVEHWSSQLVLLAETRDKKVYAGLFSHFAPRLKSYAMRLGMNDVTAEEMAQEALLNVWRKAHMFNPEKAVASTWIFTLTRNLCIDRMRKEQYPMVELPEESIEEGSDRFGENAVVARQVAEIVSQLPEKQAEVVYRSFYQGLSHSEIAADLDIPLGSVKSRMRLAFQKMKAAWGEQYEH
ncbi:MAG: sigma-70 family RNA polymerase sigma factor [Pontibacterium sp.]